MTLIFDWSLIIKKFQIWRLITPFCFFGGFGISTAINIYMLSNYSPKYERSPINTGGGGTAPDYVLMLAICGSLIAVVNTMIIGYPLFGSTLLFSVIYVWSKTNYDQDASIYGFQLKAGFFPFALIGIHLITGSDIKQDILGLAAGHVYYFLTSVYPEMSGGRDLIHTPVWLISACHRAINRGAPAYVPPVATDGQRQWGARINTVGGGGEVAAAAPAAAARGGGGRGGRGGIGMASPGQVAPPAAAATGGYSWGTGGRVLGEQ
jgi:Derlin-2/3